MSLRITYNAYVYMSIHDESENIGRSLHWAAFKLRDSGERGHLGGAGVRKGSTGSWAQRAWQGGLRVLTPTLVLLMLAFLISGCGPGFPIMTAEQETFGLDVTELKDRVAALEGGTTAGGADMQEELNMEMAETASGLEEIRQEFSFIRGNLEEADFERTQIKDEIQSGLDTLQGVSERLDPLEAGLLETREQLEALTASLDSASKAAAALGDRLTALEGKSTEAAIAAIAKAERNEQDPEDLYAEGFKAIKDTEYRRASDRFTRFIDAYPEHKLADHAQYWLGEIYYAKGDWEKAILEFDKVIKNYPEGDKVPAATLKQGYSFGKLGLTKEAKVLLGHVVEKFPKSDEAVKAKSRLEELKGASKN